MIIFLVLDELRGPAFDELKFSNQIQPKLGVYSGEKIGKWGDVDKWPLPKYPPTQNGDFRGVFGSYFNLLLT